MDWILGLLGFGSLATYLAIAIFAPAALNVVSPLLRGIMEGLVEGVKVEWQGFKNVVSSWQAIVFVLTLCLFANLYGPIIGSPDKEIIYQEVPCKDTNAGVKKKIQKEYQDLQHQWRFW